MLAVTTDQMFVAPAGETRSQTLRDGRFILAWILALVAAKLWLVHTEDIIGSATQYDALWFVRSAKNWFWRSPYDWIAFVRPAAYPLWLAAVHFCGVRLRLATELLELAGYATVSYSLMRAGVARVICICAFTLLAFHPGSFRWNDYTMADTFYAAILPFAFSALVMLLITRRVIYALVAGFALAVLWNTREESLLLVIVMIGFITIWMVRERSLTRAAQHIVVPAAAMLATFFVIVLTIYVANYRTFHAFAKSEMSAPAFEAAFKSLLRIRPTTTQRFIAVSTESLRKGFAISPTFAILAPKLDGPIGHLWKEETFNRLGIRNEIGVNWMMWAIRNAASEAGIHASAVTADHFYKKVAGEINRACDDGRIPHRFVLLSFLDPAAWRSASYIPNSFCRMMKLFVLRYEFAALPDDAVLLPSERALYDEMTLRRSRDDLAKQTDDISVRMERAVGVAHRFLVFALMLGGSVAVVRLFVVRSHFDAKDPVYAVVALLLVIIVPRIAFFTVIDATSWPVNDERFLLPITPLANVFLLLVIYQAFPSSRAKSRDPVAAA